MIDQGAGRLSHHTRSFVDTTGGVDTAELGAEMALRSCPALGQMTDLYAPASVSPWVQAASCRTQPRPRRLSAGEAHPAGAGSTASK